MKRNMRKRIGILVFLTMLLGIWALWDADLSFAGPAASEPNITVYIDGEQEDGGPIFKGTGDMGLWAPGTEDSGTMRIYNNYSDRIRVGNLGLTMKLEKPAGDGYQEVTDKSLYEEYAKNMKLTIEKGRLLVFDSTIYDKSFYEMLYQKNNPDYQGYDLPLLDRFSIEKGDAADFKYTVRMDEKDGNDLQGVRATVAFLLNVRENPDPYNPPSGGGGHNGGGGHGGKIVEEPEDKYPDISGHWAHDCIVALLQHEIIKGYPDGSIRPDNYITRNEAAVLIARALKLEPEDKFFSGYIDYIPGWAKGYVIAGTREKVLKGYTGRLFRGGKDITREEMNAALIRAFKTKADRSVELGFVDKDQVSAWALADVKAGVGSKIIEGYPDNTFRPQGKITRAETFTIICKLLGYHEEHNVKTE